MRTSLPRPRRGAPRPAPAFAALFSLFLAAGAEASEQRPRIGLVLSGGGARGLAHVGALKVLEELEVPIDFVAGTSIGAMVGGMYAAGLAPEEIERELVALDWAELLRGEPPRRALSFRRKEDDRRYFFDLELGIGPEGLTLPRGALSASSIDFLLRSQTLRVARIEDFDRLGVPFRAVAVDLVAGERVTLADGDLARVLRASMAIPGVFPPVKIGDRLLVDGGVLDNLPVDVAREMGAEVVIAVDVGTPLLGREELRGMSEVLAQATSVASVARNEEQRALADLVIDPELTPYGNFDFPAVAEIIAAGERAAREHTAALRAFSDPAAFAAALEAQRRPPAPRPVVVGVEIEGEERLAEDLIRARIATPVGEPLDVGLLRADLDRIRQLAELESVGFDLVPTEAGSRLLIRVKEKPWGPGYLRFGLSLADDLRGDNRIDVLASYTRSSINRLGAEWRNELQAGQSRRAFTELYQPLDWRGRFFVAPSGELREDVTNVYVDGRRIAEYDVRRRLAGLDLGIAFGPFGELRLGLRWGDARAEAVVGAPDLPELEADVGGIAGRLVIDRLDSATFPRRGRLVTLEGFYSEPALGADDAYTRLTGSFSRFLSRGRHTAFLTLAGGGSLDGDLPPYDELLVGGLFSLSGYGEGELRGQYSGVVRTGYLHQLSVLPLPFDSAVYVGGWLEAGNVWQSTADVGFDDLRYALTLAAGADTPLGPIYFAYGLADDDRDRFYLVAGRRF